MDTSRGDCYRWWKRKREGWRRSGPVCIITMLCDVTHTIRYICFEFAKCFIVSVLDGFTCTIASVIADAPLALRLWLDLYRKKGYPLIWILFCIVFMLNIIIDFANFLNQYEFYITKKRRKNHPEQVQEEIDELA